MSSESDACSSIEAASDTPKIGTRPPASPLVAIVRASNDAIISKDLEGRILSWNPAAERIFGYSTEEVLGQSILLIVPPDRLEEERGIIHTIRSGGHIDELETIRLAKGGRPIEVAMTIAPVLDAEGTIIGAVKVARDLSARRETEKRLRRRDRALRRAHKRLSAHATAADRQRALEAGFNDHLVKPVDLPTLERAISGWLDGRTGRS